jgi:hypothetical protein
MHSLAAANVIRVFDFYLALMFVLSLSRRYPIYLDILRLGIALRGRWPKLLDRLRQHHGVLVTTEVLRPLGLAVALMVIQFLCSRLIFPKATLTVGTMAAGVWPLTVILVAAVPMWLVDAYFLIVVARIDRRTSEAYLDTAEFWLTNWKAHAVRAATLGLYDPRVVVDTEVKKSMTTLSKSFSRTAWWVAAQVACRMTCGLTIWTVWSVVKRSEWWGS